MNHRQENEHSNRFSAASYKDPERVLRAVEAVDEVIRITEDVDVVLDNVVERVREVLGSDRAWLFHPCNPDVPSSTIRYESASPDYPGAKAMMKDVPMSGPISEFCRGALSEPGRPFLNPVDGVNTIDDFSRRLGVQSVMYMALKPKVGDAWMFGLHQCDHCRIWDGHDVQLFRIIGNRIRDCLSNMLYVRRLRDSEERFRTMADHTYDWEFWRGPDGRYEYVSPSCERVTGYGPKAFEEDPGLMAKIVHPEDRSMFLDHLREEDSTEVASIDFRIITRSGETRWIRHICRPVYGRGDTYLGCRASNRDETEGKAAEADMQIKSEAMEASMEGLAILDTDEKYVYLNEAHAEIYGYVSPEELMNQSWKVLYDDVERRRFEKEIMPRFSRDGQWRGEATGRKKNGELFPQEVSLTGLRGGGLICVVRDICARKQAEKELLESDKKFRTLFDESPQAISLTDLGSGKLVDVNRKFCEVTDYRKDQLIGKTTVELGFFSETARERFMGELKINKAVNGLEMTFEPRNGKRITAETYARIINISGKSFVLAMLKDLTTQRRLESQLTQVQKMESVGRLAGGVAHDFNNMLGVILGRAEMALMNLKPGDAYHKDFQEIRKVADRSADLTRQLLAFARKQPIAPRVLRLNDTVEGMLKMLRRLIGEDIDLIWQPHGNLWRVKMDPSQIDQILANLCVNARDAISGVGTVTIKTENTVLDEARCAGHSDVVPGEYVMLTVHDNGPGMKKETLDNIFEPFFTTKEVGDGTGLGLATVYGIVKQNNGLIDVHSEPGEGTAFEICFPRHEIPMERVPSETAALPIMRGQEGVLLVEDDLKILNVSKLMLERLGYKVLAVSTPDEAVGMAKADRKDIHLLITDVVMPGMSGKALAEQIEEIRPQIKILFMSGYTADIIAHRGVLDEGVHFIQKPFSLQALSRKVRDTLDSNRV